MEKEFIELVNSNRALIYKVCHLYCFEQEQRKDLFGEIVLQLWKSFPAFNHRSSTSTWVYRVALNTAITALRNESKKPEQKQSSLSGLEIPDAAWPPEDKTSILYQAIEKLNEVEKAIIMLYLDEKTYEEISEIIGISNSNVGARINRIKTKLSHIVKKSQNEFR